MFVPASSAENLKSSSIAFQKNETFILKLNNLTMESELLRKRGF